MGSLDALFTPASVGLVGATDRPGSVGRAIYENLIATFDGSIYPINPNRDSVFTRECYPSVAEAPPFELAVVAVPPESAIDVVHAAGKNGVAGIVMITAGFAEHDDAGATREADLIAAAAAHDLPVIGPNSLGVASTPIGLNATFSPTRPHPGSVSLLSQSGAFVTAAIDWANYHDLGFRHIVSLGNKAVVDATDVIEYWDTDPGTDVIIGYLEGIDRGRAFINAATAATPETPIVCIKAGRSTVGARAAASHTGTIAGSDRAYDAAFAQAGVRRVGRAETLFNHAQMLAEFPPLQTKSVAVVTNAGGPGVMAADAIAAGPLTLATLHESTTTHLQSVLPAAATVDNPIDVVGDADADRFQAAIQAAAADASVGSVLVVAAPTAVLSYPELARVIGDLRQQTTLPVVACLMGGSQAAEAGTELTNSSVPNYVDPVRATDGLATLAHTEQPSTSTPSPPAYDDVRPDLARDIIAAHRETGTVQLGVEAMGILDAYGISTPHSEIVTSSSAAQQAAKRIGGPVVMKVVSPDIVHKSDIDGVEVDIPPGAVADTYERLQTRVQQHQPSATVSGIQIQEHIALAETTETIVGTTRDPQFGQLVVFGLGGLFVEVLEDTTLRVGPITRSDARAMIEDIKATPLLRGARGRPPADEDAIVDAICRVSRLVEDIPDIAELDINPLVAGPDGVTAVDLRLTVSSSPSADNGDR